MKEGIYTLKVAENIWRTKPWAPAQLIGLEGSIGTIPIEFEFNVALQYLTNQVSGLPGDHITGNFWSQAWTNVMRRP